MGYTHRWRRQRLSLISFWLKMMKVWHTQNNLKVTFFFILCKKNQFVSISKIVNLGQKPLFAEEQLICNIECKGIFNMTKLSGKIRSCKPVLRGSAPTSPSMARMTQCRHRRTSGSLQAQEQSPADHNQCIIYLTYLYSYSSLIICCSALNMIIDYCLTLT